MDDLPMGDNANNFPCRFLRGSILKRDRLKRDAAVVVGCPPPLRYDLAAMAG
jgi:hypothetical protein